jgi:hypothetical protein
VDEHKRLTIKVFNKGVWPYITIYNIIIITTDNNLLIINVCACVCVCVCVWPTGDNGDREKLFVDDGGEGRCAVVVDYFNYLIIYWYRSRYAISGRNKYIIYIVGLI